MQAFTSTGDRTSRLIMLMWRFGDPIRYRHGSWRRPPKKPMWRTALWPLIAETLLILLFQSFSNSCSLTTFTSNCSALANLLPDSSPATT